MAIATIGSVATGTEQSADTSYSISHTLTSGSDRIVLLAITAWGSNSGDVIALAASQPTYNGVVMTTATSDSINVGGSGNTYFSGLYYLKEASLPANGTYTASATFTVSISEKAFVVTGLSGIDQTTTVRTGGSNKASSGTSTSVAVTTTSGDWAIGSLNQYSGTPTKNASDVDIGSAVGSGDFTDCYVSYEAATGASTTVGWTLASSQEHCLVVIPFIPASAGGTTVTPSTASLTTTKFAPTVSVSDHKTVVPSTKALTLSTFAPSVIKGTIVTPSLATLSLTGFAPSVIKGTVVTPGVVALTTTKFAPTVSVTDNKIVVPGVVALTTTKFAPTVTTSGSQTAIPGVASLTLTRFAPTVTVSDHKVVTPGVATLSLTTYAPIVTNVTVASPVLYVDLLTGRVYYFKALN